jgi:hypothetical protein
MWLKFLQWFGSLFSWEKRCKHKVYLVGGGKLGCSVCEHEIIHQNGKWVRLDNKWNESK